MDFPEHVEDRIYNLNLCEESNSVIMSKIMR